MCRCAAWRSPSTRSLAVSRTARQTYGTLIRVLAYCGLRWGELSGLRVGDVDFRRGRLEVRHRVVEFGGRQIESTPKDHEARSIPVPVMILIGLDGLTPHELRHAATSLAISAGAPVKVVQRMLGHASRRHPRHLLRPLRR